MTIEYTDAIDEMFGMFNDGWTAGAAAIVGYVPEVRTEGVEYRSDMDTTKYWARFSIRTTEETQASLKNADSNQIYRARGLVFIQIFGPLSDSKSFRNCQRLAQMTKKVYRGHSTNGSIWFRDSSVKELGPEVSWNRINVVSNYEYDELGA